jgi:hypothetical protein
MNKVFLRYLDPGFRYVKSQNPALVRCRDDALRDGLNCVALAHLVIRDLFGYVLPGTGLSTQSNGYDGSFAGPVTLASDSL